MGQKTETGVPSHLPMSASLSTAENVAVERIASRTTVDQARLLLVDDRPELLKSLSEIVRLHDFKVTEALGGRAALALLDTQEFDVVLLDLVMPDVSGHDVLDFASAR
jgi:PleD family two-component response regulator